MSMETIRATILGRFNTQFSASQPSVPIHWENVSGRPADARASWVLVQILWGDQQIMNSGPDTQRRLRRTGLLSVSIFCPPGEGSKTATQIADDVEAAARQVTASGVRFHTPSTLPNPAEETYFSYIVNTPFLVDEFH